MATAQVHLTNALTHTKMAIASLMLDPQQISDDPSITMRLSSLIGDLRINVIVYDLAAGMSGKEVASKYGLSPSRISQIKKEYMK